MMGKSVKSFLEHFPQVESVNPKIRKTPQVLSREHKPDFLQGRSRGNLREELTDFQSAENGVRIT